MALQKAQRSSVKMKIGFAGTSGSGKTYSALLFAKGLVGDWDKIAVLDTENASSNLYAHLGDFYSMNMGPPYSPQRYCAAIDYFIKEGVECMIIDSVSHEWEGAGGVLQIHESLGGQFRHWAQVTPMHQAFIDKILHANIHILVTTRRKQDYSMDKNAQGKTVPTKVGLKEIQRDGWEYQLTTNFAIEQNHLALASKDRTGLFDTDVPFLIDEAVGKKVRDWNLNI